MDIQRLLPGDDTTPAARLCAEVQSLHAAAEPQRYKQPGPQFVREVAEWLAVLLDDPNYFLLVGVVNGDPVAYAGAILTVRPDNIFSPPRTQLHIDQFGVAEKHRRRGYGRELLAELAEIGRTCGADRISLDVQAFNSGAIAFYRRFGFEVARHSMRLPIR